MPPGESCNLLQVSQLACQMQGAKPSAEGYQEVRYRTYSIFAGPTLQPALCEENT